MTYAYKESFAYFQRPDGTCVAVDVSNVTFSIGTHDPLPPKPPPTVHLTHSARVLILSRTGGGPGRFAETVEVYNDDAHTIARWVSKPNRAERRKRR